MLLVCHEEEGGSTTALDPLPYSYDGHTHMGPRSCSKGIDMSELFHDAVGSRLHLQSQQGLLIISLYQRLSRSVRMYFVVHLLGRVHEYPRYEGTPVVIKWWATIVVSAKYIQLW